ncbi:MAG: sulfatase [Acidobacteriota bacterium]
MKRFRILLYLILIAGTIITILFSFRSGEKNIFLITLDTTRADHIDYSLGDNERTPNLAKLASEGVYYENAFSLIPITLPSHASMFYSLPPHMLNVYNNGDFVNVNHNSVVQILKNNGFSTKGIVSLGVLKSEFGLNRGFDEVIENFLNGIFYIDARSINSEVFKMLEGESRKTFYWIHYSDPHSPYFTPFYKGGEFRMFLNKIPVYTCESTDYRKINLELSLIPGENILNFRTRIPNRVRYNNKIRIDAISFLDFKIQSDTSSKDYKVVYPKDWNKREDKNEVNFGTQKRKGKILLINKMQKDIKIKISFIYRIIETKPSSRYLYRESVKFLDKQIGKLLEHLKKRGIYKNSVFIIVGDHGEGLGEFKNLVGHVDYLNSIFTKVPLIISGKGIKRKGENTIPVSTLEIAPTILKFAGIKKPPYMIGENLIELKQKKNIFLETYSPEAYHDGFSILAYPFQLIYYPERKQENFEFYNINTDNNGINSIIKNDKFNDIIRGLKKKLINFTQIQKKIKRRNKSKLSEDQKAMLKSLGYL